MKTTIVAGALGLLLFYGCIAVPAVHAQEKCSLQTFAGTYAFYDKGSSLILNPTEQPFPVHASGAMAPFVALGQITFGPDGAGHGYYWIRIGSLNGGLAPIPVEVTITEMNADCTGKIRYSINLPGAPAPTLVVERFVLFDNGREYRSLPSFIDSTGIPTLAWLGVGRRIHKPSEPVNSCGSHTAHGTYLISAENIVTPAPDLGFADTLLLHLKVSSTGDYTGMLYEKYGPLPVELPVRGRFTVNPDCSFEQSLNLTIQENPVTINIRGVYFNEGKELFGLAMDEGLYYSIAQGNRISK